MLNLIQNIKPAQASLASISAAFTGELASMLNLSSLEAVNTAFQHCAWVIAILAGIVSIVNGTKKWFYHSKNNQKDQEDDNDYNSEP